MKTSLRSVSIVFVLTLLFSTLSAFGQTGLLISQIYGGGGNSGAQFTNDFIELYNPTNAAISTTGLSVQYASSAGTTWNTFALPTASIAPGHFYLIQAAAGAASPAPLPTPDAVIPTAQTFNMSATTGKVALVNSTAALTGACPLPNTIVLDFIGFGTANCSEGAVAPAPSNSTADIRSTPPVDTNNNSIDFTTAAPNPHNSTFGGSAGALSATGLANPASVIAGQTATLTVTVTPATTPVPSTNIAVTGDLRLIGGSQTQAFTDNGDGTFSFTSTVTTAGSGLLSIPITIIDAQSDSASTTINLTVAQPAPVVAIHDIQGVKSTTAATVSPFVGQRVQTTGIVTAILPNGFFIQSQSPDGNPLTPEGVEVFTSSKPPTATVAIGNVVTVTGTVATFPAITASQTPATEISGTPTITLVSTGNPLPAPIALTAAMLTPTGGLYQLTPFEGMRVSVASITAVSGTNGSITDANESNELATSTGYFYGVITGTPRPFREPGIDIRDVAIPGAPAAIAQFDDNPERILIDTTIAGGTSLEIPTNTVLPNVTGVLDFTFSSDSFYDPSRLILDATYDRTQVTAGMTVQPVPLPAANQFTVASFNIERFYNTNAADDLYYVPAGVNGFNGSSSTPMLSAGQTFTSEAVDVTPAAYTRRLQKVSLAIRNVLNTPDIVTLEEVENQSVANDIANQINTDAGISNLYTAYSTDNSAFYTQDGTGISVGFLVKNSTVDKLAVTQFGQLHTFTVTGAATPITLNDRPWLVLSAGIKRANAKDYPVTVIVNHMKALTGVNSTSPSTRQKKELQAEDIAKYIQTLQAAGQHVISGGDFNAFEFSDGYTDTLATYTNTNVLPATQVVQHGVAGLVTPPLTDLALLLPTDQRWSYSEDGSAQILDHMVVTPDLVAAGAQLAYAHLDADFPVTAYNDATTPARTSDHDPAVGYFTLPAPVSAATLTPPTATFPSTAIGVHSSGQAFTLTNTGDLALTITSITTTGAFAASNNCGATLAPGATCAINVVFTPTAAGAASGQLQAVTSASATALTSALTGTGAAPPDFTVADANGKTSTSITIFPGTIGTVTIVVTPINAFTGTVTLTCTATGTAPAGVTCTPPPSFALATSPSMQNVLFTTTARTSTSGLSLTGNRSRSITTLTLAMAGLLMLFAGRSRRLGKITVRGAGLFTLLLAICIPSIGCSSGTQSNPGGTPAGTYTYNITATSGAIVHTEAVTLTVN